MNPTGLPCAPGYEKYQTAILHMLGQRVVAAAEQVCRDAVDGEAS